MSQRLTLSRGWLASRAVAARSIRDPALWAAVLTALTAGGGYIALRAAFAAEFKPGVSIRVGVFFALWSGCIVAAWLRGGAPERLMALVFALPVPLSYLGQRLLPPVFSRFDPLDFGIDLAALCGAALIALRANRYWPLLVAALQLNATMFHVVNALGPPMHPLAYGLLKVVWFYLLLPVIALGAWRHRIRVWRWGADVAWSPRAARNDGDAAGR